VPTIKRGRLFKNRSNIFASTGWLSFQETVFPVKGHDKIKYCA